jgi:molecular chaperone DnaJ
VRRVDHYEVLGVSRGATRDEIRAAFRRLARAHHPDGAGGGSSGDREFRQVARAWAVLGNAARRRAYDERATRGRFGAPGADGVQSFAVDEGPIYHMDLGHHSDFYQAGDPLTVREAATLTGRHEAWLRRAIRDGRLAASRDETGYLLRRRDVERLDRSTRRRPARAEPDTIRTETMETR